MKKIICFLVLIIFSSINSREFWECNYDGSIHCNKDSTCCRSKINPSGYECFPMPEAVCCSNGIGACPINFICENISGTCKSKDQNLLFLSNENDIILESTNPVVKYIDPYSTTFIIVTSFVKNLGIFNDISNNNNCLNNPEFDNELIMFLISLKSLKFDDSFPEEIRKIAQRLIDNKVIYVNESIQCGIFKQNIEKVINRIEEIFKDPKYFEKFSTHSILYLEQIRTLFIEISPLIEEQKWEELGSTLGKLVRLTFLWDFDLN
jgi:hypothetical protein